MRVNLIDVPAFGAEDSPQTMVVALTQVVVEQLNVLYEGPDPYVMIPRSAGWLPKFVPVRVILIAEEAIP